LHDGWTMPKADADPGARASFLHRAEELTPLVAVDAEGARFLLDTSDENITPSLFLKRSRGEIRSLRRAAAALGALGLWRVGGTLIDVGANVGTTTISALREHGFERAVACEPEGRNVRLLELNLVANGLRERVKVCPVAVGDSDRDVELLVARRYFGLHEVRPRGRPRPPWPGATHQVESVRQTTLDALARGAFEPASVTLLWLDVQGHEGHVLRGAGGLTDRGVPVVLELYPEALRRHGGLAHLLEIARSRYTHFVPLRGARDPLEVVSTRRLAAVTRRLLAAGGFTDVLLVRVPGPVAPSRPPLLDGSVPASPASRRRRRKLRAIDAIGAKERSEFVREARKLTPLVAAEIEGTMFIVRTAAGAEELSLFTQRSHPRLRRLEQAVSMLDELGLGERARAGAFVDIGAGAGLATVAALAWHRFARAVACEADLEARRFLELNLVANRLRTNPIPPVQPGLIWIEDPRQAGDGRELLLNPAPVVLRLGRDPLSPRLVRAVSAGRAHCIRVSGGRRPRIRPIGSLQCPSGTHVLALRLPSS
jgi:FkbM family methyltransferase